MFEFGSNKGYEVHNVILRQHSVQKSSIKKKGFICVCFVQTIAIIFANCDHLSASVALVLWSIIQD